MGGASSVATGEWGGGGGGEAETDAEEEEGEEEEEELANGELEEASSLSGASSLLPLCPPLSLNSAFSPPSSDAASDSTASSVI